MMTLMCEPCDHRHSVVCVCPQALRACVFCVSNTTYSAILSICRFIYCIQLYSNLDTEY